MQHTMRTVCADAETDQAEFNGEPEHVHSLVDFPPKVSVQTVVGHVLRRIGGKATIDGVTPVHRAVPPARSQRTLELGGPPTRAFTAA